MCVCECVCVCVCVCVCLSLSLSVRVSVCVSEYFNRTDYNFKFMELSDCSQELYEYGFAYLTIPHVKTTRNPV